MALPLRQRSRSPHGRMAARSRLPALCQHHRHGARMPPWKTPARRRGNCHRRLTETAPAVCSAPLANERRRRWCVQPTPRAPVARAAPHHCGAHVRCWPESRRRRHPYQSGAPPRTPGATALRRGAMCRALQSMRQTSNPSQAPWGPARTRQRLQPHAAGFTRCRRARAASHLERHEGVATCRAVRRDQHEKHARCSRDLRGRELPGSGEIGLGRGERGRQALFGACLQPQRRRKRSVGGVQALSTPPKHAVREVCQALGHLALRYCGLHEPCRTWQAHGRIGARAPPCVRRCLPWHHACL